MNLKTSNQIPPSLCLQSLNRLSVLSLSVKLLPSMPGANLVDLLCFKLSILLNVNLNFSSVKRAYTPTGLSNTRGGTVSMGSALFSTSIKLAGHIAS